MKFILTSSSRHVTDKWIYKLGIIPNKLKLVFIDTAAEVYDKTEADWLIIDRLELVNAGFQVSDYSLTGKNIEQLKIDLAPFDILFVSGGNTFYLLEKANNSGFSELIKGDYFREKIYIGSSAGSVICSPNIEAIKFLDDPSEANLENYDALGIVKPLIFPHVGNEYFVGRYEKALVYAREKKIEILPLRDSEYVVLDKNNDPTICF